MIAHVRTDDRDLAQEFKTAASVNQEGKPASLFLPAHLRDASSVVITLISFSASVEIAADHALVRDPQVPSHVK